MHYVVAVFVGCSVVKQNSRFLRMDRANWLGCADTQTDLRFLWIYIQRYSFSHCHGLGADITVRSARNMMGMCCLDSEIITLKAIAE